MLNLISCQKLLHVLPVDRVRLHAFHPESPCDEEARAPASQRAARSPLGQKGLQRATFLAVAAAGGMLSLGSFAKAEPIRFPADSGVVDVTAYGAIPDDGIDDTEAIQRAFNENSGSGSVIYLPPGEFHISNTIRWPGRQSFNALQGAGQAYTTLTLMDNAPGYDNAQKPKNMIFTGGPPAQRFKNSVRDLTINAGRGNPGAVGLNFCANNQGGVYDVTITTGDGGRQPGAHGLALDEQEVGPLLVKRVTVIGFDLGIRVRHTVNSVTLEDITLRGQQVAGIDNFDNYVFARNILSENRVPAIVNNGRDGTFTLTDSRLIGEGRASEVSAMRNGNPQSTLYVRNVETLGYGRAIDDVAAPAVPVGMVSEWVSGPRIGLFPGEVSSLNLPIRETPTVPHDPLEQWVSPLQFGGIPGDGKDDTAAIQAAIDSGATTVYFPRALWKRNSNQAYDLSDTIYIRGNVRRLVGLEASFEVTRTLKNQPEKPVFVFEDGVQPVVVMERLRFTFDRFPNVALLHRSSRDLVLSAFSELHKPRHEGRGDLFLEDTVGPHVYVGPGSTLYARQLNIEGGDFKLVNDGGTVWVLGLKTECRSPIVLTKAGGRTEIIGGHLYKCVEQGVDRISFVTEDGGRMSLAGVGEYVWDPKFATEIQIEETQAGQQRFASKHELPRHGNSAVIPLYLGTPATAERTAAAQAAPAVPAPVVSLENATAASLSLKFNTTGQESHPEGGYLVYLGVNEGQPFGRFRSMARHGGLTPATEYTYSVVAVDRFGNRSAATHFTGSTTPDLTAPTTPRDLKTLYLTDALVHLRWEASSDEIGVTGYWVEREGIAGAPMQPVSVGAKREFIDEAVTKGTAYTYRVIAVDAAGNRSTPAVLPVTVPAHPPYTIRQEAERFSDKEGSVQKGWFISNLHGGCWMLYPQLELGREAPYDQLVIRYGAPNDRAGCRIKIILDPVFDDSGKSRKVIGGTEIAEVIVQSTGGWERFQEFTMPVAIDRPGKRDVLLLIDRGDAKASNALVNIDWFQLGFANRPQ